MSHQPVSFDELIQRSQLVWAEGRLDFLAEVYRKEATGNTSAAFMAGHERFKTEIARADSLRPIADTEFLVSCRPGQFLLTNSTLYILLAEGTAIPLEDIADIASTGVVKQTLTIDLRSGERLTFAGMSATPESRFVATLRDGREPQDDQYWEAQFTAATNTTDKRVALENIRDEATARRLRNKLAQLAEAGSRQEDVETFGTIAAIVVGLLVGVSPLLVAFFTGSHVTELMSEQLQAAIMFTGAASYCAIRTTTLLIARPGCRRFTAHLALNLITGVLYAYPVAWLTPAAATVGAWLNFMPPWAPTQTAAESLQQMINAGFSFVFTLLAWAAYAALVGLLWIGVGRLLAQLTNTPVHRRLEREDALDYGVDRVGTLLLFTAQFVVLGWWI